MALLKKKPRIVNLHPTEDQEQTLLVTWLEKNRILHYAIPNGGKRSFTEGCKLKRTGVKAGVPDLCLPVPTKCHHGLYIELKRVSGGILSPAQRDWLVKLRNQGYAAECCLGFEHAKQVVIEYLNM